MQMESRATRYETGVWRALAAGPGVRRVVIGVVVAVGGTAALTPLAVELDFPGLVYLPIVVVATAIGGLWPGLLAAGASFASFLFAFRVPQGQLRIETDLFVVVVLGGVAVLVSYVDAARRAARAGEERLAFLAEANRALNASLDPEQTLDHLTRLAVPRIADWCAVNIRREQAASMRQHVAHADPRKVSIVQEMTERYPPDPLDPNSPVNQVLASGQPILLRRIPESLIEAGARNEEHLRMIRDLKLRSAILVPLLGRRRPIGVLTLVYAESGRRYGQSDMTFAEEMAAMAAMAFDNAQLHQERSRIADTLQSSLLPSEIPVIPGVELAARYRPAGEGNLVGGDFYDVFEAGEGTWAVALGDVCGKGPEAAALTGLVRHSLRTAAVREPRPSRVLSSVNRQILRHEDDRFCTVALARLRRSNGKLELTVSSGGHPVPLVYRAKQTVESIDCAGTLLGVFKTPDLIDHPVTLEPGDAAIFYTDGVTERFEREGGRGEAALVSLLWSCDGLDAAGIADRIYRDAGVIEPEQSRDDMAMVVLRVSPAML